MANTMDHLHEGSCTVRPSGALTGTIRVPGDKSISHRAVMMGSLANGKTVIRGFLESEDCINTLNAFRQMGIASESNEQEIVIHGAGLRGLKEPDQFIDMGNSGTGARLLLGILAGQPFAVSLTGDSSLRSRPMGRVTIPLAQMGAQFLGRDNNLKLPLTVRGGDLKGIEYNSPVASAQIKSSILLAGLFADGTTTVIEPGPSRDHTERMLKTFGVDLRQDRFQCSLKGGQEMQGGTIDVPGDISSAAFFLVAASIVPGSDLTIEGVGINPTRTGILDVLHEMGADITLKNERDYGAEPVADIHIKYSPLKGTTVTGDTVVRMIDEFPIFAVAALSAETPSVVEGAEELRVKESDRIATIVKELGKMGGEIIEREDGFEVQKKAVFHGAGCFSHGDHRIAMSIAVAALSAQNETKIQGTAPVNTSFPGFFDLLNKAIPGSVVQDS